MPSDVERGIALLRNNACLNCHSVDGTFKVGPTFQQLWGKKQSVVTSGVTHDVVVDEAYVARSVREPDADLVVGFSAGTMPKLAATDDDVHALVAVLQAPDALREAANQRSRMIWSVAIAGAIFAVVFVVMTVLRERRRNEAKSI